MKIKSILLLLVSAILLSTTSCNDTDFDPRADWKDITLVYGFINLSDSAHYIRVFKAFLGPGNVLDMAKEPDSVYYPEGALDVTLKHYDIRNGSLKNEFCPDRVVLDDREPGIFTTKNILYKFDHKFNESNDKNDSLVLEIEVAGTGKKMHSKIDFVSFRFTSDYYRDGYTFNNITLDNNKSSKIPLSDINGVKTVEMYMIYYYDEAPVGVTDTSLFVRKSIIWNMAEQELDNTVATPYEIRYTPNQLFSILEESLEENPAVNRYHTSLGRLVVWAGSEELYFYNNVNKPSGIILDRPEYTNITSNTGNDDAYGIFTSRFDKSFSVNILMSMEDLRTINRQFVPYP